MLISTPNGRAPLIVPQGFTGGAVTASSTWSNTTIDGLGLSPGTYTYTWGTAGISTGKAIAMALIFGF